MKVDVESMEGCKRRLAVEAPLEVVQKEWERAYGRVQKQARLPGFRRGHVPRSLVKLHFADDVRREVAEHLIPDVYRKAVAEAQLDPVDEPQLQDVKLEEGAPLSFVAVVEVKPTITLGDYTGLDVASVPVPITEADVDQALERLRDQHAEFRVVERQADRGDLVVIDYTLTPEDHEPSSASGHAFVIGDEGVMPEIDQAVVGMRTGEERQIGVRFPAEHRVETLRGRAGRADLKVVDVKEKVLPALDDDFAKTVGPFDTLEALRAEIRRQLEGRRGNDERRALDEKIVDALLARHEFTVPDALVMRQTAHQIEHARERLRRQGVDPERVPWDYGKLVPELKPGSERAVRRALLLEAIAQREGLAPSEAEVDAEVERIAQASQRPLPAVKRMMEKSGDLDGLRLGLRERKTLDWLIAKAAATAP